MDFFWDGIVHFDPWEFDSPDEPGSGENMNTQTVRKLDVARTIAGIPFIVDSGYRTNKHNAKVGGVRDSAHLIGRGVDIRATSSAKRWLIVAALIEAGFNRIGIGKNYVHGDDDPSKAPNLIWHYYPPSGSARVLAFFGISPKQHDR